MLVDSSIEVVAATEKTLRSLGDCGIEQLTKKDRALERVHLIRTDYLTKLCMVELISTWNARSLQAHDLLEEATAANMRYHRDSHAF